MNLSKRIPLKGALKLGAAILISAIGVGVASAGSPLSDLAQRVLPSTNNVVKAPIDNAEFVSQDVPNLIPPGQDIQVSITLKNTGTSTWTRSAGYKLGSQNPQDNKTWTGGTRIYLDPSESITPGQRKTFTFKITAPSTPGIYHFQWRMVHEGVSWFGRHSRNLMIRVKVPDDARFVSQSVPSSFQPGQKTQVSITLENTGTSTWTRSAEYKLGSQNPQDNKLWTGSTRIYLDPSESVAPGQRKTFTFEIKAPSKPGLYQFQWRMVREGVGWFGQHSRNLMISVKAPTGDADDAQFVSQSVPSSLQPGQKTQVSITMMNTGTTTWTWGTGYKLGSQNPQDNKSWTDDISVLLSPSDRIAPGDRKTFSFTITAPTIPGDYNFQWRMAHGGARRFGDFTPNTVIHVTPRIGNTPTPPPGNYQPSFPIRAAFYYPWFPQAWNQKGIDPFTHYPPSLGYYDSGNTSVIRKHLDAMEYAHIDAGIASWWGPGHYTDRNLSTLLQTTSGRRFRWAVYYEDEGFGNPSAQTIQNHLQYLAANYGSDPSFLRIDGRFVVFVYGGRETCEMTDRWTNANTVNAYIVLKVFPNYRGCRNQPDGWHQYGPVQRTDSQGEFSYTISPGFWLANEDEPRLDRDLTLWYGNIRNMAASNARFHLITTFNEWGEGTSVESSEMWESSSGYGDYLDALAKNGVGFIPIKITPSITPTPSTSLTPTPGLTPSPTATSTPYITPTSTLEVTTSPTATPTPYITPTSTPWESQTPTMTPTPYISPSPTPTAQTVLWEDDRFDSLANGPLHGQNGWWNGQDSAQVIPFEGGGKILEIDPNPSATINIGKNVAKQTGGIHRFEFDVMVNGATEPSLAKLEMRTNANAGWDKKFQFYFGSSMRVNYSPSGAATNIVPTTQMGRWYHIRCDMDLDSGSMDVWVDGAKVASGIPMHLGPILGLSISGWDRAGAVYLDNLLGSN